MIRNEELLNDPAHFNFVTYLCYERREGGTDSTDHASMVTTVHIVVAKVAHHIWRVITNKYFMHLSATCDLRRPL